ncbi:MAG: Holliday junction branch migration protein RuvA [Bacilli bacterium]|jgi:Holliday junction DNA helicase RuvA|nr:Holliday junction branch migration protein RuvA [Bacilli bacterium]
MIYALKGQVVRVSDPYLYFSLKSVIFRFIVVRSKEYKLNEETTLFIYKVFYNEKEYVFAFKEEKERHFFVELLKINGIGIKTAHKIMSYANFFDLVTAINSENHAFFTKLKGVRKTNLEDLFRHFNKKQNKHQKLVNSPIVEDAFIALSKLGYLKSEIKEAYKKIESLKIEDLEELILTMLEVLNNER